jgi:glucokinase
MNEGLILAGDIGGTNTRLAIFPAHSTLQSRVFIEKYESDSATSLGQLVDHFCRDHDIALSALMAASFAIAGPVVKNQVEVTNLPWMVSGAALSDSLGGIPVELINDLVGLSNYIPALQADQQVILNRGEAIPGAAKAVIAPGTGLGEAFLIWDGAQYRPQPSEGGHASFSPVNPRQVDLLEYMLPKYGHVSMEHVCSGLGIPDLFAFLAETGAYDIPDDWVDRLEDSDDQTRRIVEAAMRPDPIPICRETLLLFIEILGTEAGNLGLKILAYGGLYLGGGIPPRILPLLEEHFMASYRAKGRFEDVVQQFPVYVVTHENPNLYGAARWALALIDSQE